MITSSAVPAPLLPDPRRVSRRHALHYDFAGARLGMGIHGCDWTEPFVTSARVNTPDALTKEVS